MADDFSKVVQQLQIANQRLESLERLQKEGGTAKGIIAAALPEVINERNLSKRKEQFDTQQGITQVDEEQRRTTEVLSDKLEDQTSEIKSSSKNTEQQIKSSSGEVKSAVMQSSNLLDASGNKLDKIATEQNQSNDNQERTIQDIQKERKALREDLRTRTDLAGKSAAREKKFQDADLKLKLEQLNLMKQDPNIDPARQKELQKDIRDAQGSSIAKALEPVKNAFTGVRDRLKKLGAIPLGIPGLTLGRLSGLFAIGLIIRFLRSDRFQEIITLLDTPKNAQRLESAFNGLKAIVGFFDKVGDGLFDLLVLIGGPPAGPGGREVGRFEYFKNNFMEILLAVGSIGLLLAPGLLFKGLGILLWNPVSKAFTFKTGRGLKSSVMALATFLGFVQKDIDAATQGLAKTAGGGASPVRSSGLRIGSTINFGGKQYLVAKEGFRVLGEGGKPGALTSSTMTGLIDDAARTGKISSLPSAASQTPGGVSGYQKLLESKGYARIAGIVGRGVPILGTLLTGAFAANILLNDDISRGEKVKQLGGLLFSTLGATGLGLLAFSATGGPFNPFISVPSFLFGAFAGGVAGDKIGQGIADFLLGGGGELPTISKDTAPLGIGGGGQNFESQGFGFQNPFQGPFGRFLLGSLQGNTNDQRTNDLFMNAVLSRETSREGNGAVAATFLSNNNQNMQTTVNHRVNVLEFQDRVTGRIIDTAMA